MRLRFAGILIFASIAVAPHVHAADEHPLFISDLAAVGDRLWYTTNDGKLWEVTTNAPEPMVAGFPLEWDYRAVESDGEAVPVALAASRRRPGYFVLQRTSGSEERRVGAFDLERDESIKAFGFTAGRWLILTPTRVVTREIGGTVKIEKLCESCEARDPGDPRGTEGIYPVSTAITDGLIYAGFYHGEWGGGLARIYPGDGTIRFHRIPVHRRRLCGGYLNAECDPVTKIASDPDHPGCVVAISSLAHRVDQGRIVRLCGVTETPLLVLRHSQDYESEPDPFIPSPCVPSAWRPALPKGEKRFGTELLSGLAYENGAWWTAGRPGYYEVRGGKYRCHLKPAWERFGTLRWRPVDRRMIAIAFVPNDQSKYPMEYDEYMLQIPQLLLDHLLTHSVPYTKPELAPIK